MSERRIRWFRPTVPFVLIGAFVGWLPRVNGNAEIEFHGALVGAAVGFIFGVFCDVAVNHPSPTKPGDPPPPEA
jgi:hypothetical protein